LATIGYVFKWRFNQQRSNTIFVFIDRPVEASTI